MSEEIFVVFLYLYQGTYQEITSNNRFKIWTNDNPLDVTDFHIDGDEIVFGGEIKKVKIKVLSPTFLNNLIGKGRIIFFGEINSIIYGELIIPNRNDW